ncbi:histamine H3 receptor-like [Lytechinus pictus]|uniref:histamine H3 receptor-like n=1 Tax=Lytechinus pictus TaxID=7653 RepID=UPI0030B9C166
MSNTSDFDKYEDTTTSGSLDEYPFSTTWSVPLILTAIALITVIGNIFVVLAYFRDPKIRITVANIYILNMAISDFLVGAVIMSVNLAWVILDYWPFGEVFCKLWCIIDHTLSMVSIMTMLLISWDRYCLLTKGVKYIRNRGHKRTTYTVVSLWIGLITVYSILAFTWSSISGEHNVNYDEECEMEFLTHLSATIVVNLLEFILPFAILVVVYVGVFVYIKRRSKGFVGNRINPDMLSYGASTTRFQNTRIEQESTQNRQQSGPRSTSSEGATEQLEGIESSLDPALETKRSKCCWKEDPSVAQARQQDPNPESENNNWPSKKDNKTLVRHRRAALVLTVLVGCYTICYLPYNITSVVFSICGFECVSDRVWETVSNFLWCNSTLNPFIYAATNVHFRRNFRQFLGLNRWKFNFKRFKISTRKADNSIGNANK